MGEKKEQKIVELFRIHDFITTKELRKQGWSHFMIKRLLGSADVAFKPHRGENRQEMTFFHLSRVKEAKQTQKFKREMITVKQRALRIKIEEIENSEVSVQGYTQNELFVATVNRYNMTLKEMGSKKRYTINEMPMLLLKRLSVELLRRSSPEYTLAAKDIKSPIFFIVKKKVNALIGEAYPYL